MKIKKLKSKEDIHRINRWEKKLDYDYDMVMIYCPCCHSKFVDVVRPYLWEKR